MPRLLSHWVSGERSLPIGLFASSIVITLLCWPSVMCPHFVVLLFFSFLVPDEQTTTVYLKFWRFSKSTENCQWNVETVSGKLYRGLDSSGCQPLCYTRI